MKVELFDAKVLSPLVSYLKRYGAVCESFLNRAAIPAELIVTGGWISKKQAYDFTFDIVQRLRSPDAVFSAYLDFQLDDLGPIATAIRSCKTVKEALGVAARLGQIAYEGSEYFLKTEGATTWFCYREPNVVSEGQTYINDMTLAVYFELIRLLADENWRPQQMLTKGRSIDRHCTVPEFEDCRVSCHTAYSALAFPTRFLRRRLTWQRTPGSLDASLTWLSAPDGNEPIIDTLYRLLASLFPYRKLPKLDQLAVLVGASPATLKRQLHAAGMSYGRLIDRLRFDAACEMLSDPRMRISEIALELGYAGANNFVRGFRRMTGLTPGEYRLRQDIGSQSILR